MQLRDNKASWAVCFVTSSARDLRLHASLGRHSAPQHSESWRSQNKMRQTNWASFVASRLPFNRAAHGSRWGIVLTSLLVLESHSKRLFIERNSHLNIFNVGFLRVCSIANAEPLIRVDSVYWFTVTNCTPFFYWLLHSSLSTSECQCAMFGHEMCIWMEARERTSSWLWINFVFIVQRIFECISNKHSRAP